MFGRRSDSKANTLNHYIILVEKMEIKVRLGQILQNVKHPQLKILQIGL